MKKKKSITVDSKPAQIQKIVLTAPTPSVVETKVIPTEELIPEPTVVPRVKPRSISTLESTQTFHRPASISISAKHVVVAASPQIIQGETKIEMPVQNGVFSDEELEEAWQRFAETIPEQGRMVSYLLSSIPKRISTTTFEVIVNNIFQEKELKRLQQDILEYMRLQLKNSNVSMSIKLAEENENQRSNTPEDRYKIMAEMNPALAKLRSGLNLEID